jgi:hypothetical protein
MVYEIKLRARHSDRRDYVAHMQRDFARNGFTASPLTVAQIVHCWRSGLDHDRCYGVGCDVNSGYTFWRAVQVNGGQA